MRYFNVGKNVMLNAFYIFVNPRPGWHPSRVPQATAGGRSAASSPAPFVRFGLAQELEPEQVYKG